MYIDFGKYRNQLPYPERPNAIKRRLLSEANLDNVPLTKHQREQREEEITKQAKQEFEALAAVYQKEENRLLELFWEDVNKDFGLTDISQAKRLILQWYAYEKGHSIGYSEIYNHYCDIVDLYRRLQRAD